MPKEQRYFMIRRKSDGKTLRAGVYPSWSNGKGKVWRGIHSVRASLAGYRNKELLSKENDFDLELVEFAMKEVDSGELWEKIKL